MTGAASYAIDTRGTVLWTDSGFAELARLNDVPDLPEQAVGRRLDHFVAGARPKALQAKLIERARASAEPVDLRYRCDSPSQRRHAVLRMAVGPDGALVFTTWFEAIEDRPPLALIDPRLPRGDGSVRLCAWCNRFDVGGWREADHALSRIPLTNLPRVEPGLCEVCELLLTTRPAGGPRWSDPRGPA